MPWPQVAQATCIVATSWMTELGGTFRSAINILNAITTQDAVAWDAYDSTIFQNLCIKVSIPGIMKELQTRSQVSLDVEYTKTQLLERMIKFSRSLEAREAAHDLLNEAWNKADKVFDEFYYETKKADEIVKELGRQLELCKGKTDSIVLTLELHAIFHPRLGGIGAFKSVRFNVTVGRTTGKLVTLSVGYIEASVKHR